MKDKITINKSSYSRRDFLRKGLYGVGVSSAMPLFLRQTSAALTADSLLSDSEANPNRILVVVELSGGNDGLNTVVPHGNDEYYRVRPTLGIPKDKLLNIDDEFGFHPSLTAFEQFYNQGDLAVVHGCGYPNPSLSHFASMGFWHTAVPNGGEPLGWVGRFADAYHPEPVENFLVNIANSQSAAVRSELHTPLVFKNPGQFRRDGTEAQMSAFEKLGKNGRHDNPTLSFLKRVAANAAESSVFVQDAFAAYRTPIDYGVGDLATDLRKVAALINSNMPTRVYYVSYGGNSFDTHVHQADLHNRLLMYTSDGIRGFMRDLKRLGRADDVAIMMFTEFGRRVEENASRGTDHGTATPMFLLGSQVKGGLYGPHPSLTELDDGNLIMTTDFRKVYATMIKEWMGHEDTKTLLKGDFGTLGAFA